MPISADLNDQDLTGSVEKVYDIQDLKRVE